MSTFTIKIQQVGQELDVVTLLGPLTASEAKTAVFEQDASWVGALREAGSSALLAGAVELKSGCTYTLTLQRPAGECWLLFLLFWLIALLAAVRS